ncbi:MAG: NAD(+) diphosphatase [Spirochaetales bacterium]|nr:NAD(+) diphosphatase [Spirochaetales bacterium]
MRFTAKFIPPKKYRGSAFWFFFKQDKLLVKRGEGIKALPYIDNTLQHDVPYIRFQYLGILDGEHCFSAQLADSFKPGPGLYLLSLRKLYGLVDESLFSLARRAYLIVRWDQNNQYCGRCGKLTHDSSKERAKVCACCDLIMYPRIAPAIIVAVMRGTRILLAHAKRFKNNTYSVIAGFVEPGETLEECVEREVFEEVGIKVKDITYFKSQSWPFPNSLMIAFNARYAAGDIKVDGKEIDHAAWFTAKKLPLIPPPMSIARELIDWFVEKQR